MTIACVKSSSTELIACPHNSFRIALVLGLLLCPLAGYALDGRDSGLISHIPSEEMFGSRTYQWIGECSDGKIHAIVEHGFLYGNGETWKKVLDYPFETTRGVVIDPSGRAYVGFRRDFGYVEGEVNGERRYRSLLDELPERFRSNIEWRPQFIDAKGYLYVSSDRDVFTWKDGKVHQVWENLVSKARGVFQINGEICYCTRSLALGKLNPDGTHEVFDIPKVAEFEDTRNFAQIDSSAVYIAAGDYGLLKFDGQQLQSVQFSFDGEVRKHPVSKVEALSDGRLAVVTYQDGVAISSESGEIQRYLSDFFSVDIRSLQSAL